ncbi:unnamed protein product [Lampetra fluviatilis]
MHLFRQQTQQIPLPSHPHELWTVAVNRRIWTSHGRLRSSPARVEDVPPADDRVADRTINRRPSVERNERWRERKRRQVHDRRPRMG